LQDLRYWFVLLQNKPIPHIKNFDMASQHIFLHGVIHHCLYGYPVLIDLGKKPSLAAGSGLRESKADTAMATSK